MDSLSNEIANLLDSVNLRRFQETWSYENYQDDIFPVDDIQIDL